MIRFILNDKTIATDLPAGMVILDFIRYHQHLTGTKIGCREGDCGACTVLVGELVNSELHYESMTSCLMPLGNAHGKHIVSIEGVNLNTLNPVQQAMADEGATQCGFCTPGFVMSLAGYCLNDGSGSDETVITAVDGNICRCTGYKSIERAAARVADMMKERNGEDAIGFVTRKKILPAYFSDIKYRLGNVVETQNIASPQQQNIAPPQQQNIAPAETQNIAPAETQNIAPAETQNIASLRHVVGGGTDLYVQKHDEMTHAAIRFVFDQPELNGITREGNKCIIGPSATVTDLKNSPVINEVFPNFQRYAKLVSSTPIRNMATIAGNFVNASPIGDFTIFFLALDAQLVLRSQPQTPSSEGRLRMLPLRKLYKGYKQLDKKPDEHIEQIWFEIPGKDSFFHFEKVSKRTHLDIASVNSAIHLKMKGDKIESAGISAGGVGPVPMYLQKTSEFLKGKKISDELVQQAIEVMKTEISPISDARGTKEYKTLLLGQLMRAHFITLNEEMAAEKILK